VGTAHRCALLKARLSLWQLPEDLISRKFVTGCVGNGKDWDTTGLLRGPQLGREEQGIDPNVLEQGMDVQSDIHTIATGQ
jgi:hypothetical protein